MNAFQWVCLPLLIYAVLREARFIGAKHRRARPIRPHALILWTAAAIAIAFPQTTQLLADLFGVDRGADLVQYFFVLAFSWFAFNLHGQTFALEQQMAELVRQQAIKEAAFGKQQLKRAAA